MTVALTDEQARNWAATHRSMANVLDPPATLIPTPSSGGGSTPDPSGFTGRTLDDPAVWKQQASFEENFPTLAPRGQFLSVYKIWSATNYVSTDKLGIYDPCNIEVVALDGLKVMQVRIVFGLTNGRGKPGQYAAIGARDSNITIIGGTWDHKVAQRSCPDSTPVAGVHDLVTT